MRYVKFVEDNDHEGETWTFWLQLDGNEVEMDRLERVLDEYESRIEGDSEYMIDTGVELPEHDVDVLVEHGGEGYMANHTKVQGVLTVPDGLIEDTDYGPEIDRFYKGGIKSLFVEETS